MLEKETKLLFDAMMNQYSIEQIGKMLEEEIFKNPVVLTNPFTHINYMNNEISLDDEIWNYTKVYGVHSKQALIAYRRDQKALKSFATHEPFYYNYGLGKKLPRILCKIVHKERVLGYFVVFEAFHSFSEEDFEKAKLVNQFLRIVMENQEVSVNQKEFFIRELLTLNDSNRLRLENEMIQYGTKVEPFFKAVVGKHVLGEGTYNFYVCEQLNQLEKTTAFVYKDHVVALFNYKEIKQLESFMNEVEQIASENHFLMGASMSYKNGLFFRYYYEQALRAKELGQLLDGAKSIYSYSKYMDYDQMTRFTKDELKTFICKEYEILKKYDDENETDYVQTCCTYLRNACNVTNTSQALEIHRNTLFYRLRHIEQLANMKMDQVDILMLIENSYKIHRWISIQD